MKTFTVTFKDEIKAKTEGNAYDDLLNYLQQCVDNGDVTAFNFKEVTK